MNENAIAVIGMACRFPLGNSPEEFWENLKAGKEAVRFLRKSELTNVALAESNLPGYVAAASIIEGIEDFDPGFFGLTPREAEILDPQLRVLLECAYHALEQGGYDDCSIGRDIGVFVGSGSSHYAGQNLLSHPDIVETMGYMALSIANERDFTATQLAYRLNLRGPALSINTACSTSLVAIHQAVNALLNYECDAALAGGATIRPQQHQGYLYQQGGILSPDGHCRPFSDDAHGTISGNGGAVVLLKRLVDAIADGNIIEAVIIGSAVNNDGADKMGITAPSVIGQARVIREAIYAAEITTNQIAYIEAHGTGTPLGDPIEIQALNEAYLDFMEGEYRCAVGSVKSNMGHLDTAAGIAGFIKTVLAIKHGMIPPSINFSSENKKINFNKFFVSSSLREWPSSHQPRCAGVSSFGIGGTNAHIILAEAPENKELNPRGYMSDAVDATLTAIVLSAKSEKSLRGYVKKLAAYVHAESNVTLKQLASALIKKPAYPYRMAFVAQDKKQMCDLLQLQVSHCVENAPTLVWLFPGQGAQYPGMAKFLYDSSPVFNDSFSECCRIVEKLSDVLLIPLIFPSSEREASDSKKLLDNTRYTQIAVFVIDYCLARVFLSSGIKPDIMLGHSLGEYVAACIAGIFSLEDAIKVVLKRGEIIAHCEPGSMISVAAGASDVSEFIRGDIALASNNAGNSCVLAGPSLSIAVTAEALHDKGIVTKILATSHAFHSSMMDAAIPDFTKVLQGVKLNPPSYPILSNLDGKVLDAQRAMDPGYWIKQLRESVCFQQSIEWLENNKSSPFYMEFGPGQSLCSLVKRNGVARERVVNLLPHADNQEASGEVFLQACAAAWKNGINVNLKDLDFSETKNRVKNQESATQTIRTKLATDEFHLPSYVFDKARYWIEPAPFALSTHEALLATREMQAAGLYSVTWLPVAWPNIVPAVAGEKTLLLSDYAQPSSPQQNNNVVVSRSHAFGEKHYEKIDGLRDGCLTRYQLVPTQVEHWEQLLNSLNKAGNTIANVDYRWTIDCHYQPHHKLEPQEKIIEHYLILSALVKALRTTGALNQSLKLRISTVGVFQVTGKDKINPVFRAITSALRIIGQEEPNLKIYLLDLDDELSQRYAYRSLDETLLHANLSKVSAIRGNRFYHEHFTAAIPASVNAHQSLPHYGVVIFIGGLGRAGSSLCEQLASRCKQLVVSGRRSLTDLDNYATKELSALTSLHNNIVYVPVDISSSSAVNQFIQTVTAEFGTVDLVIHGAGEMNITALQMCSDTDRHQCEKQLIAKVSGTRHLYEAGRLHAVKNILLMSSLSSVLGGIGMSAYAMGNAFMDAFADGLAQENNIDLLPKCFSLALDGLKTKNSLATEGRAPDYSLDARTVMIAIDQLLQMASAESFILCAGDLYPRYQQALNPVITTQRKGIALAAGNGERIIEPLVGSIEHQVAELFSTLIGAYPIGALDNFFELGGDSLLVTQLVSRLKNIYLVDIGIAVIFEYSTVRALAEQIILLQSVSASESIESLIDHIDQLDDDEIHRLLLAEAN